MALKVLQCTALDLSTEIQSLVDSNPMLEYEGDQPNTESVETDFSAPESESTIAETAQWEKDIPQQLAVDSAWDDHYASSAGPALSESDYDPLVNQTEDLSLQRHLAAQLDLFELTVTDRIIAEYIIDSLDHNGWLNVAIDELVETINENEPFDAPIERDEFDAVLKRVQQLEPAGVAATSLNECLILQLQVLTDTTPFREQAIQLVQYMMPLLMSQEFSKLRKRLRCSESELALIIQLIQSLDPHPGALYQSNDTEYVIPEVLVTPSDSGWQVQINPEVAPRLTINKEYASLVKRGDTTDQNKYLKQNLQEAQWFIKSIDNRFDTLFNVANAIVEKQIEFFEKGPRYMKPMILADVATALDLHESTISRATTGKYMMTPQGIFELKYFFSSHVSSENGDTSSTAIKAIIKRLVDDEPPQKPLSDAKLVAHLEEEGVSVARRTVAKYREALGIASSSQRKRLK